MTLPNPKFIIKLIDQYLDSRKEEWSSISGLAKSGGKWLTSAVTGNYQSPAEKKNICEELKKELAVEPKDEKNNIEKCINICLRTGRDGTKTLNADVPTSDLAKLLHFVRTYHLSKIMIGVESHDQLKKYIEKLKSGSFAKEAKEKEEDRLLDLIYLGEEEFVGSAQKKGLLKRYPKDAKGQFPHLSDKYFRDEFFDEVIRPGSNFETFEEYEEKILAEISAAEKTTSVNKAVSLPPLSSSSSVLIALDAPLVAVSPKSSISTTTIVAPSVPHEKKIVPAPAIAPQPLAAPVATDGNKVVPAVVPPPPPLPTIAESVVQPAISSAKNSSSTVDPAVPSESVASTSSSVSSVVTILFPAKGANRYIAHPPSVPPKPIIFGNPHNISNTTLRR